METQTVQKIQDLIGQNEKVSIVVGKDPSTDVMAAALSLYLTLQKMGKRVRIACPSTPLVELSSLVGIDKIKKDLSGEGGDLVVSFPYREGEIEKVSYTLDNGYLNIVVKAGLDGLTFSEEDIKYKRGGSTPRILFVIGTSRLSDLGDLFNPQSLKETTVINIDNKKDNQNFGDIVLVSSQFSSVSEQVATLIASMQLTIDVDIAQNLLSGISTATNNFQKEDTSVNAFEMAAILMKKGAVRIVGVKQPSSIDPFFQPKSSDISGKLGKFEKDAKQLEKQPEVKKDRKDLKEPPSDWLMPKVYKGSTAI